MAITQPLIFERIRVGAAGAALASMTNYDLHLTDSASVTVTPITDMVDDGQTLVSGYDVAFTVTVYNTSLLSDGNVYTNAALSPTSAKIVFDGVNGATSLNVDNVIINGSRVFDGNRMGITVQGSKRGVAIDDVVLPF